MLRSMITATNTMGQLQKQLDTIGHNLANIDTQGYKREQTAFSELVRQQFNNQTDAEAEIGRFGTELGITQGTGARLNSSIVFSQGTIKQTGRSLEPPLAPPELVPWPAPSAQNPRSRVTTLRRHERQA